jgi:hypothetical protein
MQRFTWVNQQQPYIRDLQHQGVERSAEHTLAARAVRLSVENRLLLVVGSGDFVLVGSLIGTLRGSFKKINLLLDDQALLVTDNLGDFHQIRTNLPQVPFGAGNCNFRALHGLFGDGTGRGSWLSN